MPQLVAQGLFNNLLQNHVADFLRLALFFTPGVVVTDVLCRFDPPTDPGNGKG